MSKCLHLQNVATIIASSPARSLRSCQSHPLTTSDSPQVNTVFIMRAVPEGICSFFLILDMRRSGNGGGANYQLTFGGRKSGPKNDDWHIFNVNGSQACMLYVTFFKVVNWDEGQVSALRHHAHRMFELCLRSILTNFIRTNAKQYYLITIHFEEVDELPT